MLPYSQPPARYEEGAAIIPRGERALPLGAILVFGETSVQSCSCHVGEMTNVGDSFTNDAAPGSWEPTSHTGRGRRHRAWHR